MCLASCSIMPCESSVEIDCPSLERLSRRLGRSDSIHDVSVPVAILCIAVTGTCLAVAIAVACINKRTRSARSGAWSGTRLGEVPSKVANADERRPLPEQTAEDQWAQQDLLKEPRPGAAPCAALAAVPRTPPPFSPRSPKASPRTPPWTPPPTPPASQPGHPASLAQWPTAFGPSLDFHPGSPLQTPQQTPQRTPPHTPPRTPPGTPPRTPPRTPLCRSRTPSFTSNMSARTPPLQPWTPRLAAFAWPPWTPRDQELAADGSEGAGGSCYRV